MEPLVAEVEAKVHELADIFSLTLPDGLEYRDVLAEAHRQLTGVATQAAEDLLRSRVPERPEVDEDWVLAELGSLTNALTDACARPIETTAAPIGAENPPPAGSAASAGSSSATAVAARPAASPKNTPLRAESIGPLDRRRGGLPFRTPPIEPAAGQTYGRR